MVPIRMNNNKRAVLCRMKTLFTSHSKSFHSLTPKGDIQHQLSPEITSHFSASQDRTDLSKWKALDARELGITSSMISQQSWVVLDLLRRKGFESYLVGGCVRDLLLKRTPKDFDVITTAELTEVRKHFRRLARAEVVGRRFPVCLVHINGSIVEVTSFDTVARTSKGNASNLYSMLPKFSNKKDLIRCKNSLRRDFTINSLFYDPFANKIYDYANGLADLKSMKLETVIPAQVSFEEDPGRILRGFRIAARLGLSLSRETEVALRTCSSLVKNMNKNKLMIELNYMLSYGAAGPSLRLLWKFKLLDFLLPLHAAYLDDQANKEDAQASNMLMKLFCHLDNLVACDQPSDCTLWIGLLAFHLALVNNPQDAVVVRTFASVLYHGEWEKGVKFAKERIEMCIHFAPEIMKSDVYKSDEEIAKAVTKLASLVMDSIPALVENNICVQLMSRYPSFSRSGIVFVPRKTGKHVSELFKVLVNGIQFYSSERKSSKINYNMLGKGHLREARYVFGKIVLETMNSGIVGDGKDFEAAKCHLKIDGAKETDQLQLSDPVNHQLVARKNKRHVSSTPNPEHNQEKIKKRRLVENGGTPVQKMGKLEYKETDEEHKKVDLSTKDSGAREKNYHRKQLVNDRNKSGITSKSFLDKAKHVKMVEQNRCTPAQSTVSKNHPVTADNCNIKVDAKTTNESDLKKKLHLSADDDFKKKGQEPPKIKQSQPILSNLFK
ncbi:hypothetical protein TanjilG_22079 [Lupinus angustifolius]|uniref:Poly A polymerase head domain-containing protein n=1 Tax=Lupinus angustifolius TaxID=3871 RepID=A0A4P1QTW7_LUPAN|nr:PREDICTED: uncharacterized protein LOC109331393 [Lupinus angustifolius]OIV94882.1 hypothetical protein TanjilG_22079 [Lupinus angustifolius]